MDNPLLCTDVYKMGHLEQYRPGTQRVYSYLMARSVRRRPYTVFFGLQYLLARYLCQPITHDHVREYFHFRDRILGEPARTEVRDKFHRLAERGRPSLQIKAVPEGTVMPARNVLLTVANTEPDAYWEVGFFESLLLKVWYPTTVASFSLGLLRLLSDYAARTCDASDHVAYQLHDFGYRSTSSEETSALGGAAHLLSFRGTDTVPAVRLLERYYGGADVIGQSVPASEHSVMCSYGRAGEFQAFEHMLDTYPTGIVSIVSDTYDVWQVLTTFAQRLKPRILAREGRVVFRPDSGNPVHVLCGDPAAAEGSPQRLGALRLLERTFGSHINTRGYRVLDPHVGLIYGDGFDEPRLREILAHVEAAGFATSNLVFGMGGHLLQDHTRDDQGFALKATYTEVDGQPCEIYKAPVTDPGKKSHRGLLQLQRDGNQYRTREQVSWQEEASGELRPVYRNGELLAPQPLDEIRQRVTQGAALAVVE